MRPLNSHLDISERHVIYNMIRQNKFTQADIARALKRDPSIISRELKRNLTESGYDPARAQKLYYHRKLGTVYRKKFDPRIFPFFKAELKSGKSPDVIAGTLKTSKDKNYHVATQTLYNWTYEGRFGSGLRNFLLFGRRRYAKRGKKSVDSDKKRVEEMPECSRLRDRLGDFEGDTIIGAKQKGALITLVDRKSLYIFADVLKNKMAETFTETLRDLFADLDSDKLKSLLFDNGSEMSWWKSIEEMLQIPVYFTHPGRPWEKPLIENANRMLRRFFPKKMELDKLTSEEVLRAVNWLNNYPRKSLNYRTPHEVFFNIEPVAFAF